MNFEIDNETKVIALLSGYASDLGKGKDFENTTYALAEQITKMFDKEKESYHQSKIDAITDDKIYYEALLDCCNKLLDEVEKGQVPKRQIMGLKLLLNRN